MSRSRRNRQGHSASQRTTQRTDRRWREIPDLHHDVVRSQLVVYRGREVRTIGDGFLATFDGPARAIRCAVAIRERVAAHGLEIRAGLHTGEIELSDTDVGGIAVHIAARVASLAEKGEVLVTRTVKDLVAGSGLHLKNGVSTISKVFQKPGHCSP